ncbi:hypothetical protein [Micromonospora costi]|uniref:hypothetical protein n=1 Tax=Micromonospora costi TaxID=1530042 RepID=UPI001F4EC785|nr:hypothetical protein [Micromonospora costi]
MEQFDVHPNELVIVAFDLGEFLGYVHPVMVRHFDVSALDHDVHVTSLARTVFDRYDRSLAPRDEAPLGVDR